MSECTQFTSSKQQEIKLDEVTKKNQAKECSRTNVKKLASDDETKTEYRNIATLSLRLRSYKKLA